MEESKNGVAGLRLLSTRDTNTEATWFSLGFSGAKLIGWTDEDATENPHLKSVKTVAQILVAPFGTAAMRQHRSRLEKRHRRFRDAQGDLPPDIEEQIGYQVTAHHVLLDWRGVALADGTEGEYTPQKGIQALREDSRFENVVIRCALDLMEGRQAALEEDEAVLGNGSGGT